MLCRCFIKPCLESKPLSIEKFDNYINWLILPANLCSISNHYTGLTAVSENTVHGMSQTFLVPLFLHWFLVIITDSSKWNSKLEAQLTFWWPQGSWEVQRAGKGGRQSGGRLGKCPAGLIMWGWGIEYGSLRQPQGASPLPCFYTLNTCLKPWRLWWSDHDKELLDYSARLTFQCKLALWNKYNVVVKTYLGVRQIMRMCDWQLLLIFISVLQVYILFSQLKYPY